MVSGTAIIFANCSVGANAFAPRARLSSRSSSTDLHMSAALIVQNKGGGHGELGK